MAVASWGSWTIPARSSGPSTLRHANSKRARLDQQRAASHRGAEARRLEVRVPPEIASLPRVEPEQIEPERRHQQEQGDDVRAEEVATAPVEAERPPAEVRIGNQEPLLSSLEEGVVQRERHAVEERGQHEDPDERPRSPPEREADPAPRGATEAIAAGPDHGDRDEDEDEEVGERLGRDDDLHVAGESRCGAQRRDRHADEQKRLDEPEQQFLAGAVISEAITLESRLA